jgi:hypothetical protein
MILYHGEVWILIDLACRRGQAVEVCVRLGSLGEEDRERWRDGVEVG